MLDYYYVELGALRTAYPKIKRRLRGKRVLVLWFHGLRSALMYNGALQVADRRKLGRDVNFLIVRWVLTVKVDKNGFFSIQGEMGVPMIPGQACLGAADRSPTATPYGFRLVPNVPPINIGICFI